MKIEKVNLGETGNFSPIFLDYIEGKPALKPFYDLSPSLENFGEKIKNRNFAASSRKVLHRVLSQQYEKFSKSLALEANIASLLGENTFTVTTGHQLNIFSGPLYFIYKIVTTINACKALKEKYPESHFVPVYWMASEDHDFAEINHFTLFGKHYSWQTEQKGAVGRFKPELGKIFEEMPEKLFLFEKAYAQETLADATRYFVNELFGDEGLVVMDADQTGLKALFKEVIKDELVNHKASELAEATSSQLTETGYKTQIFPREINLFYLDEGLRERIVKKEDRYKVLNSELSFSEEGILKLLDEHPEKFSPNVLLRPLYQEMVLPNLAYIGGPGEVAYWLQLKAVFDHYHVPFPLLMPRNFALVIVRANAKKLYKLSLYLQDLFLNGQALRAKFIEDNSNGRLKIDREKAVMQEVFESIKSKAESIDQSLEGFVGAESTKTMKIMDNIEKKLKKFEEQHHETSLNQLDTLKEKLFPGNGLQERTENYLNFQINNPSFIKTLLEKFDPFDFRFNVLIEDE